LLGGGEFVEGHAAGTDALVDDFDAVGGEVEVEAGVAVGLFAEEGAAELVPGCVGPEELFFKLGAPGDGGEDDDGVGDDRRSLLGECPDGLGEDGGGKAGGGEKDGAVARGGGCCGTARVFSWRGAWR
jgi:hypothetical protein